MSFSSDRDVRYGDDTILDAGDVVTQLGAQRVLLVCGKNAFGASGADRCLPGLENAAQVRRWSDFRANTDSADLINGLRIVEEFAPDVVLGVGGGSAMDMAKLLCAFHTITDEERLHKAIRAGDSITSRSLKLVLSPTTSGSGSEATRFAVVYIGEKKFSIAGPAMLPDTVILDPLLTISATAYQRATSGIDAFAQAIESLWASGATDESRGYAKDAMTRIVSALPRFVNEPSAESAGDMAVGSHLAGRAIDISRTTAAHALSYGFTKSYGIPHGHAVALTLGAFIEAHVDAEPDRLQDKVSKDAHSAAMSTILTTLNASTGAQAREAFTALAESIGLSLRLSDVGVTRAEQAEDLATRVNVERLGNNPVRYTAAELTQLVAQGL